MTPLLLLLLLLFLNLQGEAVIFLILLLLLNLEGGALICSAVHDSIRKVCAVEVGLLGKDLEQKKGTREKEKGKVRVRKSKG